MSVVPLRGRLGPLVEREYRLLFSATTITTLGDAVAGIALAFAVLDLTGHATDLGIVIATRQVANAAVLLFGGVLSDRLPRNRILVGASLVQGTAQAATATFVLSGHATVALLVGLQALYGAGNGFVIPAEIGLIPQTVSAARLQQANALQGLSRNLVYVLGPAIGGVIVVAGNPGTALAIDACSFVVCAALLARIRIPARLDLVAGSRFFHELREGWREFVSRTWLWSTVILFGVGNVFFMFWSVLGPAEARARLGGAGAWATILAVSGIGAVVGGLVALRHRPSRPLVACVLWPMLWTLQLVALAAGAPTWLIAAASFFGGLGIAVHLTLWFTVLQREIPERARSRVSSYDSLGSFVLTPLGTAIAGPVAAAIGTPNALWLAVGAFLVSNSSMLLIPSVWAIRRAETVTTMAGMSVRVRMAPSPTGFLHVGGVRTFLFNWLFARGQGGECLLRIENTDTSREVAEATEQIQRSLRWLGLDWDGPVTFQLDAMERCRELAQQLVAQGRAYEDEGAVRFRMPDEGVTAWDDAVRGRIEVKNEQLEDLVIVRSDGRATYNFANPVEDMDDAITHVIRGNDHVSNTPKQLQILQALGHEPPVYAHVPDVIGADGKKLSKRHGATSIDEFRAAGYVPPALMNFLALLGWAPDGETTIMPPDELVRRFSLDRVGASPATLDYQKLDWMNGVYLRAMSPEEYAEALVAYLRERGHDWPEERIRAAAPLVQDKIERLGQFPEFAGFLFARRDGYDPKELDPDILAAAEEVLVALEPFTAESIEAALRALADRLGQKPRQAFQPIRIAVTGSKVSPGLFESIELLGRDEALARIRAARAAGA